MIPYGRQEITQTDIDAVVAVLRSDFLTQGPAVPLFEQAVGDYCGSLHAVAVNSATSALHLACMALGIGPGDWLWTSPITFVASANCGLYCGAQVDFVDIDPHTYNLSVDRLAEKLAQAEKIGKLPKVVVPVHLCGQPCNMAGIYALSKQYEFKIIEDASHAIGGKYKGEPIGNGRYSDITVFSFHPVKIITTGEGGMALTNDPLLAERMQLLRSHGIIRDSARMECESEGGWYYQQVELGYNYRMTDIQAALGISQLKRLDDFMRCRRVIAARYDAALAGLPLTTPWQHPDGVSALHLYPVRIRDVAEGSRRRVFDGLRSRGIGVNVHYIPVHLQPYYRRLGFRAGDFPEAEHYYAEAVSLPMFPTLTGLEQGQVIDALKALLT